MKLRVIWLYAGDMNIYGDYGNILALKKRAELRDIDIEVIKYNPDDKFPENIDIIIGGGGQDSGQDRIQKDLLKNAEKLRKLAEDNTPMLMICGLYQLFGDYFETISGDKIRGISLFQGVKTRGGNRRMIGNVVEDTSDFGEIVGYENHSGQTYLSEKNEPFAKIKKGDGNNFAGDYEGVRYKNVIGTYLHGSLLPKNPAITDFLLKKACENRGECFPEISKDKLKYFEKIERITDLARKIAKKRPR